MKFILIYVNRTVLVYFPTYLFSGTEAISGLTKKKDRPYFLLCGDRPTLLLTLSAALRNRAE